MNACYVSGLELGIWKDENEWATFFAFKGLSVSCALKEVCSRYSIHLFSKCLLSTSSLSRIQQWFSSGHYWHLGLDSSLMWGWPAHCGTLSIAAPAHYILVFMWHQKNLAISIPYAYFQMSLIENHCPRYCYRYLKTCKRIAYKWTYKYLISDCFHKGLSTSPPWSSSSQSQ